jgi:hypothetical protein
MYARVTNLAIDTMRADMEEALEHFEQSVLPELREQPGFEGVLALATPEGQAMLITFWATAEAAEPDGFYARNIAEFTTLFRSPPGREHYEVLHAEAPVLVPS